MNEKGNGTTAKYGAYVIDHGETTPHLWWVKALSVRLFILMKTTLPKCVFEKAYNEGVIDWKKSR